MDEIHQGNERSHSKIRLLRNPYMLIQISNGNVPP